MKVTAYFIKCPKATTHFNKGQTVWVRNLTWPSVEGRGRFRGKGRYVTAWVGFGLKCERIPIKEAEVDEDFANRHRLLTKSIAPSEPEQGGDSP